MSEQDLQLAMQHQRAGQLLEAETLYRKMLARQPSHPAALCMLGVLAQQTGRSELALELLNRATAAHPGFGDPHYHRGNILHTVGRTEEALVAYRAAIAVKPDFAQAWYGLGCILAEQGDVRQALVSFKRTVFYKPDFAQAHHNLALSLKDTGQLDQALLEAKTALLLKNPFPVAQLNLAQIMLLQGNLREGWEAFEARLRCEKFLPDHSVFLQPRWDGSDLTGRTIFLQDEQGLGDTLQMVRYVPSVADRGGRVILGCPPPLRRLLARIPGVSQWLERGQPTPHFDCYCPLMSVPRALKTDLQTIPDSVPYLSADLSDVEIWRTRLATDLGLKVGLVWAGNPDHLRDRNRSLSLSKLSSLAKVPGVTLYSLQKGEPARQIAANPHLQLVDHTQELNDFADTAALITNLDLVISVDTSVVHLAGAMGKPVWTLLDFAPDWRWMVERTDSPWYPSMRLFRQPTIGDWESVIRQVAEALVSTSQAHRGPC